jgi:hypothetical protein
MRYKRADLAIPHAGIAAQPVGQHQRNAAAVALIVQMNAVNVGSWHSGTPNLNRHRFVD